MNFDDILQDFEKSSRIRKDDKGDISRLLTTAMINERMSPEILPYQHRLMGSVLQHLINQQTFLLDSHEYGDINSDNGIISADYKLQLVIIETDIERINYLVRLYLRTRLSKLDKHPLHYMDDSIKKVDYISEQELEYLQTHFKIMTELYNNCFMKKMPEFLTYLDDTSGGQSMVTRPDLNTLVFIKCISDNPIILRSTDDDDDIEIERDGVYVVKFSIVKPYIGLGDVILI